MLRNPFAAFISSATRRHGCGASVSGGEKRMFSKPKKIAHWAIVHLCMKPRRHSPNFRRNTCARWLTSQAATIAYGVSNEAVTSRRLGHTARIPARRPEVTSLLRRISDLAYDINLRLRAFVVSAIATCCWVTPCDKAHEWSSVLRSVVKRPAFTLRERIRRKEVARTLA